MTRTFIALEMNEALQCRLEEVIHQAALVLPKLRWVKSDSIHLTLAFLGELTDGEVAGVAHAAENVAAQVRPFSYRLSGLGIFGSLQRPRVIWMEIEETTDSLAHLHRLLTRELVRRNFPIDNRPFSPHLTLSRVKAPLGSDEQQHLQHLLATPLSHADESYAVNCIHVMKSELQRSGAQYTCLYTYTLGQEKARRTH